MTEVAAAAACASHLSENCLNFADREHRIADNLSQLIGCTPMVYLSPAINPTKAKIALKMENANPLKSQKDRIALRMIEDAEKRGLLDPNDPEKNTILEATSGNTGVGLAAIGAARGYKVVICMPCGYSLERRAILAILGAKVILTPSSAGLRGLLRIVDRVRKENPNYFYSDQFANPMNAEAHYASTAPEIWNQSQGKIDAFVHASGTSGTFVGCSRFFKEKNPKIHCAIGEPDESAVISGESAGAHHIMGTGPGIIPPILEREKIFDEVMRVSSADSQAMCKRIAKEQGMYVGISTGANVVLALRMAERPEFEGKLIVTLACDTGERYLSSYTFRDVFEEVQHMAVVKIEALREEGDSPEPLPLPAPKEKQKCACCYI